jgi:hypothetical protein
MVNIMFFMRRLTTIQVNLSKPRRDYPTRGKDNSYFQSFYKLGIFRVSCTVLEADRLDRSRVWSWLAGYFVLIINPLK